MTLSKAYRNAAFHALGRSVAALTLGQWARAAEWACVSRVCSRLWRAVEREGRAPRRPPLVVVQPWGRG